MFKVEWEGGLRWLEIRSQPVSSLVKDRWQGSHLGQAGSCHRGLVSLRQTDALWRPLLRTATLPKVPWPRNRKLLATPPPSPRYSSSFPTLQHAIRITNHYNSWHTMQHRQSLRKTKSSSPITQFPYITPKFRWSNSSYQTKRRTEQNMVVTRCISWNFRFSRHRGKDKIPKHTRWKIHHYRLKEMNLSRRKWWGGREEHVKVPEKVWRWKLWNATRVAEVGSPRRNVPAYIVFLRPCFLCLKHTQ